MMDTEKFLDEYRHLTMNDIRIWLYEAGVEYPDDATREDFIQLMEKTLRN